MAEGLVPVEVEVVEGMVVDELDVELVLAWAAFAFVLVERAARLLEQRRPEVAAALRMCLPELDGHGAG